MADESRPGSTTREGVAVIIPAYNAAGTIGAAVASALAEPEVAEVVVVDDASRDDTPGAARDADDGTGRLAVHRLAANGGPSRARNVALERSTAPIVAILDSDDRLLAGRFRRLLAIPHWDLIADNMVFVTSTRGADEAATQYAAWPQRTATTVLDLATFARGNVGTPGARRREMGFIHPLMRRAFLDRHAIRYNEAMRLGEDFDLYARALLADARFLLCSTPGYLAVEREDSLSAMHRVEDLAAFLACHDGLERARPLTRAEAEALALHRRSVEGRYALRRVLADKAAHGVGPAAAWLAVRPRLWAPVLAGVARDKVAARQARRGIPADTRAATLFDIPRHDPAPAAPRADVRLAGGPQ
ncbi:glycosyltransferase family 2 protein [Acuticoccus sp. I52.16.1]|uniref:glycosyltransferase family 2 protein n=1 Tax=Acuticoccus sp. I52.16.1 TaxID=2928472 RepID=UPI001FD0CD58|nr:glycosyltransferase family 2 protein [Acuticoccus sp. I52.16.1]UOM36238.1 glycosyltransferase family 2 protein [Acuticoccus sp. I52.16.1]